MSAGGSGEPCDAAAAQGLRALTVPSGCRTKALGDGVGAVEAGLELRAGVADVSEVEHHVARGLGLPGPRLAAHNDGLAAPVVDHRPVRRTRNLKGVRRLGWERVGILVLREHRLREEAHPLVRIDSNEHGAAARVNRVVRVPRSKLVEHEAGVDGVGLAKVWRVAGPGLAWQRAVRHRHRPGRQPPKE